MTIAADMFRCVTAIVSCLLDPCFVFCWFDCVDFDVDTMICKCFRKAFFFSIMNPVFLCLISLNILVFNSIESVDDAGEFA